VFSPLPKLADKAFIIGFLVPILFATFGLLVGFRDLPLVQGAAVSVSDEKALVKLTAFAAAVWFGSVTLLLLNGPIYRMFEGYVGPLSLRSFKARATSDWLKHDRERQKLRKIAQDAPHNDAARKTYLRFFEGSGGGRRPQSASCCRPGSAL
jgi:hypothetical protein